MVPIEIESALITNMKYEIYKYVYDNIWYSVDNWIFGMEGLTGTRKVNQYQTF